MYAAHFGLREPPFALTPDPGYLYLGPGHREALAHLLYGISEDGGFVQLTGEVGTGKTTLIRALLAQRPPEVDVALCLNPRLTVNEFVATLCDELGIKTESGGLKALIDALNRHLLATHARGRHTVVIIDEAQNLSPEVLEQVRLLTNLETHRHKLLRMVLVGQPELQTLLARPGLRQLAQRITARCHLRPLDRRTARAYLDHRLRVAGGQPELFSSAAGRIVQRRAGGIPRLLNIIGDRALLGAYARDRNRVDAGIARRAAREVLHGDRSCPRFRWPVWATAALLALLAVAGWHQGELLRNPPAERLLADVLPITPEPASTPAPVAAPEPTPTESASAETPLRLTQLDEQYGLRRLLTLWEGDPGLADSADVCAALPATGLRCRNARTDWNGLRRYNRPALLTLNDPRDGTVHRILLTALHDDAATLMLDDGPRTVGMERLNGMWNGEALLLWRPPTRAELLRPGSRGDDVVWLRRQLAETDDRPLSEPVSELFDAELAQRVREFQRRHGLHVDGLAGPDTLLILTSVAPAPDTPRLVPASGQV